MIRNNRGSARIPFDWASLFVRAASRDESVSLDPIFGGDAIFLLDWHANRRMPTGSPPPTRQAAAARGWGKSLSLACLLIAAPTPLLAETAQHGPSEAVFIAQIILLLLCGRLLGEIMQRIGQPAIMGQLLSGVLLGPSVLGALWPGLEHTLFPPTAEQKATPT